MNKIITIENTDIFFEPILSFFASWIGYHNLYATRQYNVVSGRLRGNIIPQLTFEDDPIIGLLKRQESIEMLTFNLNYKYPGKPKGKRIKSSRLMEFWCQQMIGHSYEISKTNIISKYTEDRKQSWPPVLQFFYHIRNGCFHGNRFNIRKNSLSKNIKTEWRGKKITEYDNNKKVAGDFLLPADFIVLLYDIQSLL